MSDGTQFAIALILFWVAGLCFFVAFHPGGIKIGDRAAQNPVDVLRYLIGLATHGSDAKGGGVAAPTADGTQATGV